MPVDPDDTFTDPAQMEATNQTRPSTTLGSSRGPSLNETVAMKLSSKQDVMFPAHAFGTGGIGNFLARGRQRAGLNQLPWGSRASTSHSCVRALSAGSASNTNRAWNSSTASETASLGLPGSFAPSRGLSTRGSQATTSSRPFSSTTSTTSKSWEQVVPHPHDFQPASRSSRIWDVPFASRWVGLSFYENNPHEVKRHLDITNQLDQVHAASKAEERAAERARHRAWTLQQRAVFRRQRQELAMKYEAMNLPLRPSQAWVLSSDSEIKPPATDQEGCPDASTAPAPAAINLPKPTFVKVYDRMSHEIQDSPRLKADAWRKARQQEKVHKEHETVRAEVAELDDFEAHLRSTRNQGRQQAV